MYKRMYMCNFNNHSLSINGFRLHMYFKGIEMFNDEKLSVLIIRNIDHLF